MWCARNPHIAVYTTKCTMPFHPKQPVAESGSCLFERSAAESRNAGIGSDLNFERTDRREVSREIYALLKRSFVKAWISRLVSAKADSSLEIHPAVDPRIPRLVALLLARDDNRLLRDDKYLFLRIIKVTISHNSGTSGNVNNIPSFSFTCFIKYPAYSGVFSSGILCAYQ